MTYTSSTPLQTLINGIAIAEAGKPGIPLPNFQHYRRVHYRKSRPCKINILIRRVLRDLNMTNPGRRKMSRAAMMNPDDINDERNAF